MEFELDSAWNEKIQSHLKSKEQKPKCPNCKAEIPSGTNTCLECGQEVGHTRERYFDPDFEKYAKEVEQENEEYLKSVKWEEVPEDEPVPEIVEELEEGNGENSRK